MQTFGWQISDEWVTKEIVIWIGGSSRWLCTQRIATPTSKPNPMPASRCPDKAGGRMTGRESAGNERPNREL